MRSTLVVLVWLLLVTASTSAQLGYKPQPSKDPYRGLFGAPDPGRQAPLLVTPRGDRQAPARPRVVCGTRLIPADPAIDPKIRVGPPDTGTAHSMRSLTPPVCQPDDSTPTSGPSRR